MKPIEAKNKAILVLQIYGYHANIINKKICNHPLGLSIPSIITDSQITSSSHETVGNVNGYASNVRLNSGACWIPKSNKTNEHLQIDLGFIKKITGFLFKPCTLLNLSVDEIRLEYSNYRLRDWKTTTKDGKLIVNQYFCFFLS